ncbi:MFS general substrate transporter [Wallemia mellicola]|nr:MFS general substrate transporter [Wallemia mellicola]
MSTASTLNEPNTTHPVSQGDEKSLWGNARQDVNTLKEAEHLGKGYYTNVSPNELNRELEKAEEDKFLVELDDGDDPKKLSTAYKWYITLLAGMQILNATYSSSVVSSAFSLIGEEYNQVQEVVVLTVSLFLAGYVFGPLLWAVIGELVGRKLTYISYLVLFICGCAAAASMVTSGGVLADIWEPIRRGRPMALYSMCPFAGPVLGPIASGFIVDYASDYKWIYWSQMVFGGCCLIGVIFSFPETMTQVILIKKAKKLRKETGDKRYHTFSELNAPPFKQQLKIAWQRPFRMLVREPILIITSLYIGVVYGVLYLSFEMFPYVFRGDYQFTVWQSGLTFCSVAIGLLISYVVNLLFDKRYLRIAKKSIRETGQRPDPEIRFLPAIFIGGPCFVIGLFWFAWTAGRTHWLAPCAAGVVLGAGVVLIFISLLSYVSDAYTLHASSALAANTVVRSIFGAVFPLFALQMFDRLTISWSGTLLALIGYKGIVFTSSKDVEAVVEYARNGARVLVGCESEESAQKFQGIDNVKTSQLNVSDFGQLASFFDNALKYLGNVDIIVANSTRREAQNIFSIENKTPTNLSIVNNNVYGILYTVHTGANALRKNPSNDKAIVFDGDGDAGPVDIENAILHASLEPNFSCTHAMFTSGVSEGWRSNIINPKQALDKDTLATAEKYNLTGVEDEKFSRRHAILVAATMQSTPASVIVDETGLSTIPHPIIRMYGIEKLKMRLRILGKIAVACVRRLLFEELLRIARLVCNHFW